MRRPKVALVAAILTAIVIGLLIWNYLDMRAHLRAVARRLDRPVHRVMNGTELPATCTIGDEFVTADGKATYRCVKARHLNWKEAAKTEGR